MDIAIISDQKQYAHFKEKTRRNSAVKVICADLALRDFLREQGADFELIEETVLKDRWEQINKWACGKALDWAIPAKENNVLFDGVEVDQALYVFFSYYLVAFLKSYLYAIYILEKYMPENMFMFENPDYARFPFSNSIRLLNISLKKLSMKYGCAINILGPDRIAEKTDSAQIKIKLRKWVQKLYSSFKRLPGTGTELIACGSLKQLSSVIKEIKSRKKDIVLYSADFRIEQLSFCVREGLDLLVPDLFRKGSPADSSDLYDYYTDFLKAVDLLKEKKWFRFFEHDLTDLICEELKIVSVPYFTEISLAAGTYASVIDSLRPKSLIVEEDWSPSRGFMCAFFKSRGVKTFCVSHGYGAQRFSLDDEKRNFHLSDTLVHSEYERSLLMSRGWDGSRVHVTGSPKYDRLLEIKERISRTKRKKPLLLFCGTSLRHYAVTQQSYIGVTQFERGQYMQDSLKKVFEAMKGLDVRLLVRPHPSDIARSADEKMLWANFIKAYNKGNDVALCSEKKDFFDILALCDAMIIGYWTPAIVEAIIMNTPTLVLNPSGLKDGFPFAKEGLCETARDTAQIRDFIIRICSDIKNNDQNNRSKDYFAKRRFYVGSENRRNSILAADKIIGLNS